MKEALSGINSADVIPWLGGAVFLGFFIFVLCKQLFVFKNAWKKILEGLVEEFSLKGFEILNLMIEVEIISADDKGRRVLGRIEERAALTKDSDDFFYTKILGMVKEIREASYGRNLNGFYEKTRDTVMQIDSILKKYAAFNDNRTLGDFAQFATEADQARKELEQRVAELTYLLASLAPKNELLLEEKLEESSEEQDAPPSKAIILVEKKKTAAANH